MARLHNQEALKLPLLWAIEMPGGRVWLPGDLDDILEELADLFQVSQQDRTATREPPDGRAPYNRWRKHVQSVRKKLLEDGDLSAPAWGVWAITEQGRCKVKMTRGA